MYETSVLFEFVVRTSRYDFCCLSEASSSRFVATIATSEGDISALLLPEATRLSVLCEPKHVCAIAALSVISFACLRDETIDIFSFNGSSFSRRSRSTSHR